jgi:hypothetical protein
MSDTNQHKSHSHIVSLVATVLCVVTALLLVINRQHAIDQLSVWQYKPTAEIVTLANRTTMNETGRFYFYASQPSVEAAKEFNTKCGRKESNTAILGCYTGRYIYVYNVTDTRLDGIREVTAAHEMLHAAYTRMGSGEKQRINTLLEAEYAKLKDNAQFAERMAFYARTEPGERDNELHSVIGTEVAAVSPALEAHYKGYFTDRRKVVDLHAKYAGVFESLQTRSDALSRQLNQLGDKIEQESLAYNAAVTDFDEDFEGFKARVDDGRFSSQEELDTERLALVKRAEQLDGQRQAIDGELSDYEVLRQELMSIASQSQTLNRSIDSSLAPAPSL